MQPIIEFAQQNQGGILGSLVGLAMGYFMLSQLIGKSFDKYVPPTATPEERDRIKKENFINRLLWPLHLFNRFKPTPDPEPTPEPEPTPDPGPQPDPAPEPVPEIREK